MTLSQDNTGNVDFSDIKKDLRGLIDNLKCIEPETPESRLFKNLSRASNCGKEEL
ncbi:MAG: hypothetical protein ACTSUE_15875 [Promethearchaeota archaeon]